MSAVTRLTHRITTVVSHIAHRARYLLAVLATAVLLGAVVARTDAQIGSGSLNINPTPSEYFGSLAISGTMNTALPTGWYLHEGSTCGTQDAYAAGTGSGNTGDIYSFGAASSTERALGHLGSGGCDVAYIGAQITNNTTGVLNGFVLGYTCEHWRAQTATGVTDRMAFAYSTNATSLTTGTWTAVPALDCVETNTASNAGALNGNDAANRTAVAASLSGLAIPANGTLWIRWSGDNSAGNDDGIAVDDFEISLPTAVELESFTAQANQDGTVTLQWTTGAEWNLAGFNLYRSAVEGQVGALVNQQLIPSQGSQGQGAAYSFTDTAVTPGLWYYRLQDVDIHGSQTMHGPVQVIAGAPSAVALQETTTTTAPSVWLPVALLACATLLGLALRRRALD